MDEILKEYLKEVRVISKSNLLEKEIDVYGDAMNPLFLAKDVADWIGHSDVSTMIRVVDEDEKMSLTNPNNLCGGQKSWFLTENGLYEVLMQSRKPIAKLFKKGVKKILHEIRLKGGYMVSKPDDTPEIIMARALQIANDTIIRHEKELADAKNKIAMQHDRIGTLEGHLKYNMEEVKKLTPDAEYTRKTLSSTTSWNTNIIAKEIGLSAVTLNKRLQGLGIQYKEHGVWVLTHKYQDKGYTKTNTYNYPKSDGTLGTRIQTEWTEKGRRFIHELCDKGRI